MIKIMASFITIFVVVQVQAEKNFEKGLAYIEAEQTSFESCWYTIVATKANPEPEFSEHTQCAKNDEKGAIVVNKKHRQQLDYDVNQLATMWFKKHFFYVHKDGHSVSVLTYDNWADDFQNGLVRTKIAGKVGYVDKKLQLKIPAVYDWGFPFENGIAVVCQGCWQEPDGDHRRITGGKWGKIDTQGAVVEPLEGDRSKNG
jgi:hypothetical protein